MAIAVELVGLVALPLAFVVLPHGWDTQAALLAFAGGAIQAVSAWSPSTAPCR